MSSPSPKQTALLQYLSIGVPSTKQEASDLIDAAINNEVYAARLSGWNTDRLRLHPRLYEREAAERKASRAESLWSEANDQVGGAGFPIKRITKAQATEAVSFLDTSCPGWDANLWAEFGISIDALYDWFIPAVAKTTPTLVKRGFEDTLSFPSNVPKPIATSHSAKTRSNGSGGWALLIVGGLLILGLVGHFSRPTKPNRIAVATPAQPPRFVTAAEAQREAVRRYPELGVSGSKLNREFVARYKLYQQQRPDYFRDTSWPLHLAEELTHASQPK